MSVFAQLRANCGLRNSFLNSFFLFVKLHFHFYTEKVLGKCLNNSMLLLLYLYVLPNVGCFTRIGILLIILNKIFK